MYRMIEFVTVEFVMPPGGEDGKPVTESSSNRWMVNKSPTSGEMTTKAAPGKL